MPIERVAIVFDNIVRPDTTGIYCLRALRRMVRVEHFLPGEQDLIRREEFDVLLNIDDGLDYSLDAKLGPWTLWAIDTHLAPQRILARAQQAEYVYCAQQRGCQLVQNQGNRNVKWLPLAADPAIHGYRHVPRRLDWVFVGHMGHPRRASLMDLMTHNFPNSFAGEAYFEDMALLYSQSRVGFNCSVADDLNMRVFEVMAAGALLMTNRLEGSGLETLFRWGEHFQWFADEAELLAKMQFYLANEPLRRRIAAAGQRKVREQHTYHHRMKYLLQDVERSAPAIPSRPPAPRASGPALGCVLAIRNRPAPILDWTLQSFSLQERRPFDKLLLDYGSEHGLARDYEALCLRHGWRYVRVKPPADEWNQTLAYNLAVGLLDRRVDIVFKSDVDVLVGPGVLEQAHQLARRHFCVFTNVVATRDSTAWPVQPRLLTDFDVLLRQLDPLDIMESDGFHAFPREWFERIGGYDLSFRG